MNRRYNDIEELIGKYLAGEASGDERAIVEAWKNESADNQKNFDQYKTIFNRASSIKSDQRFDTDAAWNKVRAKIQPQKSAKTVKMSPETRISKAFLRFAASIVILITAGFFTYRLIFPERDRMQVASQNVVLRDTLPDGTNVVVNKKSRVAYAFNSRKKEHIVKLSGEAYFTVNTKKNKTFIVEAEGLVIRDIGTSFDVKAYPDSDTVQVYVQEGEVEVHAGQSSSTHLKAGESIAYIKSTKTFVSAKAQPNSIAYKTRFFVFSDESLGSVVAAINDVYEKQIVISDSLKNCRLTVTFNNEDIDEIAAVIAETLGLNVQQSEREIKLEGKGCE